MLISDVVAVTAMADLQSSINKDSLARRTVAIDGISCRSSECNLGNLVTDSMASCAYEHPSAAAEILHARREVISMWHGGSFMNRSLKVDSKVLHYSGCKFCAGLCKIFRA